MDELEEVDRSINVLKRYHARYGRQQSDEFYEQLPEFIKKYRKNDEEEKQILKALKISKTFKDKK